MSPSLTTNPAYAGFLFIVFFFVSAEFLLFLSTLSVSYDVFALLCILFYSQQSPLFMVHYSYDKIHTLDKIIYIFCCRALIRN